MVEEDVEEEDVKEGEEGDETVKEEEEGNYEEEEATEMFLFGNCGEWELISAVD